MAISNRRQTVIITGGATGIGYAVAEQFLVATLVGDITQPETARKTIDTAVNRLCTKRNRRDS